MSDRSAIEWTATRHEDGTVTPGATWNPIRGTIGRWACTRVSPGCDACYAARLNTRFGGPDYAQPGQPLNDTLRLDEKALALPYRWKAPRTIFVCSMTDLFHEDVPDGWIVSMLLTMAHTPQHTYQILTKRPTRMRDFFIRWADLAGEANDFIGVRGPEATRAAHPSGRGQLFAAYLESLGEPPPGAAYPTFDWMEGPRWWTTQPLPNVWLGVSVELDRYAWRVRVLDDTPAAVRFISAEPLLGPLPSIIRNLGRCDSTGTPITSWVITGGESGPGHRPVDLDWVRAIRDRCVDVGVAFFHKQHGGLTPKSGGRLLDGVEWNEMPGQVQAGDKVGAT